MNVSIQIDAVNTKVSPNAHNKTTEVNKHGTLQIRIFIHAVDTRSVVPVTFQPKVFLRSFSTTQKRS